MYRSEVWMNVKALRKQGLSYREIGRRLGIDRRTVKRLCECESQPRPKKRNRPSRLDPFKHIIDAWLERHPSLAATRIFERLCPLGYKGGYPTVKRYVRTKKEALSKMATVRFETLPGYQAQVDFGSERVTYLAGSALEHFFIFQLGFSRYRAIYLCDDETRATLTSCLVRAFREIGGVPSELLLDNMKPVVRCPANARGGVVFQEGWIAFCAHFGLISRACAPYRGQTKGKVERLIGIVKSELAGKVFLDREHLRNELLQRTQGYCARIHGTTKMAPKDRLDLEMSYLSPLPERPYPEDAPQLRKVSAEALISYEGNRYSVPARYAGREVKVRASGEELLIFDRAGALLFSHVLREKGSGQTVMVPEHYTGVIGAKEAFAHLKHLEALGLSPFVVEKRPLSVYEEAVNANT